MTRIKNGETFRVAMFFGAGALVGSVIGYFSRRMKKRAVGMGVRVAKVLRRSGAAEDITLRDRVRSWLGHRIEHPRLLHVEARNGVVVLSGMAVGLEPDEIVDYVRHVDGVRQVINRLTPVEQHFL